MKKRTAILLTLATCTVMAGAMSSNQAMAAKKYSIKPSTKPCDKKLRDKEVYNSKTKNYLTINSYLNKIKKRKKGGTLVLKKGTYKIPTAIKVPSKVTIRLNKGAKIVKTTSVGKSKLKVSKVLFSFTKSGATGYKGINKSKIISTNNSIIDLGNKKGYSAIQIKNSNNIEISGLKFKGRYGGAYVRVEGSSNVTIQKCNFSEGSKTLSKPTYKAAVSIDGVGTFPCKNVKVKNSKFNGLQEGISNKAVVNTSYAYGMEISGNKFTNISGRAIVGTKFNGALIFSNTIARTDDKKTSYAIYMYSAKNVRVYSNTIKNCKYCAGFGRVSSVNNSMTAECKGLLINNKVSDLTHMYIPYNNATKTRIYFENKTENSFTLTPTSKPYYERYTNCDSYTANGGQMKTYYMLRSYMEQLEDVGGGTITLKAGEYVLSHSVCIPSNVKLVLSDGVVIKKVKATNTNIATNKALLVIVPPSKSATKSTVGGYNGSQNVSIVGQGTATLNCDSVTNAMGIVMGHAKNVIIKNINFLNEYGSHFIELNSSQNVTVEDCMFKDFKIYNNKSHKEAINIDTTDSNNNGFNYEWSTHDRTACDTVNIKGCEFLNMGTAVGSHTYSVTTADKKKQVYHENVTIEKCSVNKTYNAAIRILNWKDSVIKNNDIKGVQALEDNKGYNYTCILCKGIVNPTITGNKFDRTGAKKKNYAIRILELTTAVTQGAINAGYADTISSVSEKNQADMRNNTVGEMCYKRFLTKYADGSNDLYVDKLDDDGKPVEDAEGNVVRIKNPKTLFSNCEDDDTQDDPVDDGGDKEEDDSDESAVGTSNPNKDSSNQAASGSAVSGSSVTSSSATGTLTVK
ncbi:MAG: right-handed parallel beta-helix repeat-containing protein [Eubacterium sp.]|nr:right-handed parallel beta-helix repeat-containing protein [Eubacterium sp.]